MIIMSEEDLRTELESKQNTMCPLPWKQLQVTTTGEVNPCCIWQGRPVGNLHKHSFEQIWNSPTYRRLRQIMMNGEKPEGCKKCFFLESINTHSPRWYAYRKYLNQMDTITDRTDVGGYDEEFKVECWDIRFSNVCNLRCRTCGPGASTGWYIDAEKAFGKNYLDNIRCKLNTKEVSQKILEYLLEHLDVVSEIYFVGGEPLIMPEHYKVLDQVLEKNYRNIYLRYNTNLTTLGKDDICVDYWKKLKEQGNLIEVGLSLDAVGPVAEYVRKGCRWSTVERNLDKLLESGVHIMVMPTVSILNCYGVVDLIDLCLEKGIKGWDVANPNIVTGPAHYDMRILPDLEKNQLVEHYENYLKKWEGIEDEGLRKKFFVPLIEFLHTGMENVENFRAEFVRITELLDNIRGEHFEDVVPELKNWKNW